MRPIIGITVDATHDPGELRTRGKLQLNWNYAQAIHDAGGTPVLIPPMSEPHDVARILDGWVIPGGNDIDAKNFGEENHPSVELIDPTRFNGERSLYKAIDPAMPILGICYGCQFLNVVRGGSLCQHLPDVVGTFEHTGGATQLYVVDDESKLASVAGVTEVEGKSYHHQAIKEVGAGLRVVAKAEDETIEAIEATDRPWLIGVQWHPERTLEDDATRRLFRGFVDAARAFAQQKRLAGVD
jgi:putative glutamine amidotransferase